MIKRALNGFWRFIWEDDSVWSWIANVAIAFILIKFMVYPGLGLILGTSHPIVAVVSGSMEHDGSFDEWWSSKAVCGNEYCTQSDWYVQKGISKVAFQKYGFKDGFNKGDIIVLLGKKPEKINKGDVIVFNSIYKKEPIIHRVVDVKAGSAGSEGSKEYMFQTKGDHNFDVGRYDTDIKDSTVIGKAVFRLPYLGWIKIWFVKLLSFFGANMLQG